MRLAVVGASPCERCDAACCRSTATEYAVLLQSDDERRRFAPWSLSLPVADEYGHVNHERVIAYRDGRCPFLGDDSRCTIYDDRPSACRAFECTRHFNQRGIGRHGLFLEHNPQVVMILSRLPAG